MREKAGQFGVVRADFSEEVTSEWRLETGRSQLYREPGRGKSMCKGPAVGEDFTCASSSTEAHAVEPSRQRTRPRGGWRQTRGL